MVIMVDGALDEYDAVDRVILVGAELVLRNGPTVEEARGGRYVVLVVGAAVTASGLAVVDNVPRYVTRPRCRFGRDEIAAGFDVLNR